MNGTESRQELPLASFASACSCCSTGAPEDSMTSTAGAEYALEGLTCGHCVATVEKAVTAVDGVASAAVELVRGGRSRLVLSGTPDEAALREAVACAGYSLLNPAQVR
jgi:copper chaperone